MVIRKGKNKYKQNLMSLLCYESTTLGLGGKCNKHLGKNKMYLLNTSAMITSQVMFVKK